MPEDPLSVVIANVKAGYDHYYHQRYYPAIDTLRVAESEVAKIINPHINPSQLRFDPEKAPTSPKVLRTLLTAGAARFSQRQRTFQPEGLRLDQVPGFDGGLSSEAKAALEPISENSIAPANISLQKARELARFAGDDSSKPERIEALLERFPKATFTALLKQLPDSPTRTQMFVHGKMVELPSLESNDVLNSWIQLYQERIYSDALTPLDLRLDLHDRDFDGPHYYYYDIPMGLGDSLTQAGQQFDQAIVYYTRVKNYPYLNMPIETPRLWLQMARAYLAWGDALYRTESLTEARQKYEIILKQGMPPADSPLYDGSLAIMRARVTRYLTERPLTPDGTDPTRFPPDIISALLSVQQRLLQLDNKLNFLGYPDNYVPVLSFEYLQGVARAFTQFAAQANREYLSYTQRAEEQTQNINQLEQSVALNEKGIEIEDQRRQEAAREVQSSNEAEELARVRKDVAEQSYQRYASLGWDIVRLDANTAYSGAATMPLDDENQQFLFGLNDLGISARPLPRSWQMYQLAWQRGQRAYALELDRLGGTIEELRQAEVAAQAQTLLANARLNTAASSVDLARWRAYYSRVNLMAARANEVSPSLYNELALQVKETALIYLRRAIEVAFLMQAAYEFENSVTLKRIRMDYGDIGIANGLYAADLLLRDIDYFTLDRILTSRTKTQPAARVYSLRYDFPLQFTDLQRTGRMQFHTFLTDFHEELPGIFNARIKRVELSFEGLIGQTGPIGRLTCGGVSTFRTSDGNSHPKVHNSESLLLSKYNARKDALIVDVPSTMLRVFENIGVECSWELELLKRANPFEFRNLTDIKVIISYLCQHDQGLAEHDRAALPATAIGQYGFSLRFGTGSELWKTIEQSGTGTFDFVRAMLPNNQMAPLIKDISIIAIKTDGSVPPLEVNFFSSLHGSPGDSYRTGAEGVIRIEVSSIPGAFANTNMLDRFTITLDPTRNPTLASTQPGKALDLSSISDIEIVFQYAFTYS